MLTDTQIEEIIAKSLDQLALTGQRLLVVIPDQTRSMPLPLFFRLITRYALPRAQAVDFLVALGTHPPLPEEALLGLVGLTTDEKAALYPSVRLINHAWRDADALVTLGCIPSDDIADLSGNLLQMEVPVCLNRLVLDYDQLLVCGPVFPHEVAGFSGGNKYFFPGIAGPEIIDFTHWLGALLTSWAIIGVKDTPVRAVIDRAAGLIPRPRHALCCVISRQGLEGLFFGTPETAWSAAADLSAKVHLRYVQKPYPQVLSILPAMYNEIWVGAKGMYKLEPVVADGGEVILYAPHIQEISQTHGALIRRIGYHVRDYFVRQWETFRGYPWGVLAHSTHLRGAGTFESGVERARIQVTLATGIPREICEQVNLGYRNPASIDPRVWLERQSEDLLVVPQAGETLYRLASEQAGNK
jgi:nickel-dependent lactate racemase